MKRFASNGIVEHRVLKIHKFYCYCYCYFYFIFIYLYISALVEVRPTHVMQIQLTAQSCIVTATDGPHWEHFSN